MRCPPCPHPAHSRSKSCSWSCRLGAEQRSCTHVKPSPRFILLEEWVLTFVPPVSSATLTKLESNTSTSTSASRSTSRSSSTDEETDVALLTIYKNAIPLFRVLPTWRGVPAENNGAWLRIAGAGDDSAPAQGSGGRGGRGGIHRGSGGGETMLGFGDSPGLLLLPTSMHVFPGDKPAK
ncbi:hypothetical protein FB451DRAFT_1193277 [Mycena latifolia]|nr:hypothetical protein FB451DRAFT_1193277 [Mycena latifolia]